MSSIVWSTNNEDLNVTLAMLALEEGELLQSFFLRSQGLLNNFNLHMVHHPQLVPHFPITKRFITELMRVEEYRVFLVIFQEKLLTLQKVYGEYNAGKYLDFQLSDVYEMLLQYQVPSTSNKPLLPSPNVTNSNNNGHATLQYPTIALASIEDQEIQIESWYNHDISQDSNDVSHPSISALNRGNRPFCHACLTPGHIDHSCWLRGIEFMSIELVQRINLYNQQKGNKPPPGTVIPKWKPKTPPPIINQSNKNISARDKLNEVSNQQGNGKGQSGMEVS